METDAASETIAVGDRASRTGSALPSSPRASRRRTLDRLDDLWLRPRTGYLLDGLRPPTHSGSASFVRVSQRVAHIGAFIAIAAVVICIAPGPDMALIVRNTLAAARTAFARRPASSPATPSERLPPAPASPPSSPRPIRSSLRCASFGAACLVWLGVSICAGTVESTCGRVSAAATGRAFLSNLGNPKIAVFYEPSSAVRTGFVRARSARPALQRDGRALVDRGYAVVVARARRACFRASAVSWMRSRAPVLVAFGLRLATERPSRGLH